MEDIDTKICDFIGTSTEASAILARQQECQVDPGDIQIALIEVLGIEVEADLLRRNYTTEQMVEALRGFPFAKLHPEILAEFTLDMPVLPSCIPRLLVEITIKTKGEQWRIYRNDADPFPSNPHAHNCDTGVKLDLSTGYYYLPRKKAGESPAGKIKKKALEKIRQAASTRCYGLPLPEIRC